MKKGFNITLLCMFLASCGAWSGQYAKVSPPPQPTKAELLDQLRYDMAMIEIKSFWDNEKIILKRFIEKESKIQTSVEAKQFTISKDFAVAIITIDVGMENKHVGLAYMILFKTEDKWSVKSLIIKPDRNVIPESEMPNGGIDGRL